VYVPNGRALDHDHYKYKLRWMAQLRDHAAAVSSPDGNLVIAGDYNIAPDGRDVWDEAKLQGQTHVSQAERDSLAALETWGLRDVFRDHYADAKLYSWWDYRGGDFHQGRGMRIDLMYATKAVADRTTWCGIDRNARKGEQPSDHAPVLMMLGS
jgi:exodeoxyribonuclease-3